MKKLFWLLDINHEVVDGVPEIRLWSIDESGQPMLLRDRTYRPSFYLKLGEKGKAKETIAKIHGDPTLKILDIREIKGKLLGKPIEALRIEIKNPDLVEDYGKTIAKIAKPAEPLEADIRYSAKYLIDKGILPAHWNSAEASRMKGQPSLAVSQICEITGEMTPTRSESIPDLDILAFSVTAGSEIGSPNPERDPILAVSIATNRGDLVQFSGDSARDSSIIEQFVEYVRTSNPDIILGYGSSVRDWPYLMKRAEVSRVDLRLDRSGGTPHQSLFGHISVTGRAAVDLLDFAELIPEVKIKTLTNVSKFMGAKTSEDIQEIEEHRVLQLWKDETSRRALLDTLRKRTEATLEVGQMFLGFGIEIASLVSMPLDYVMASDVGHRVESYIMRSARSIGELIPSREDRAYESYKGGFVLKPEPGIHRDIAVLDFASMYPSLMIRYNISPDTYVPADEKVPDEEVNRAPEVSYRFRKHPLGLYKEALADLIESRRRTRLEMEKVPKDNPLHRLLDARQRALKVITNAMYGYAGWAPARWYMHEVAEATAAWGRSAISNTLENAKEMGLKVIYGDTDSVFIENDQRKIQDLLSRVRSQTGIEIRVEKIYKTLLFTEAKKRYAGLTEEGSIDIVGLEFARGDWSDISRKAQERVLEILLRGGSVEEATSDVERLISKLRRGGVQIEDLVIWKTLVKPLEQYEVRAPHVEVAKILSSRGFKLTPGDKIGYLIVKGKGRLSERSVPYALARPADIDIDYYVQGQIIPAVFRVLEVFGVEEAQFRARIETASVNVPSTGQQTLV